MKATDLRKERQKWALALTEMQESQTRENSDLASLEAERLNHVVGACAEKRTDAQDSLLAVNKQIETLQASLRDKAHAIEKVSEKLDGISEELDAAEYIESVQGVLELIDRHLNDGKEKRLESLLEDVSKLVQDIAASESHIADAIGLVSKKNFADQIQALNNSSFSLRHVFELFQRHLPDAFCLDFGLEQIRDQKSKQGVSDSARGLLLSVRREVELKRRR